MELLNRNHLIVFKAFRAACFPSITSFPNSVKRSSSEESALFLCVLTIGELKRGIVAMPASTKKEAVQAFFDQQVLKRFAGRILPLDTNVMIIWGEMYAQLVKSGHPIPVMDSLIAATGLYHRATIVTRNTDDFSAAGVGIVNPWIDS